jgi:hypothetical protein
MLGSAAIPHWLAINDLALLLVSICWWLPLTGGILLNRSSYPCLLHFWRWFSLGNFLLRLSVCLNPIGIFGLLADTRLLVSSFVAVPATAYTGSGCENRVCNALVLILPKTILREASVLQSRGSKDAYCWGIFLQSLSLPELA